MTKRREPPRTVKGKDIELRTSDGQRIDARGQALFTNPRPAPKEGTLARLVGKTPFGRAAKAITRD
jgi:hypothetical protein